MTIENCELVTEGRQLNSNLWFLILVKLPHLTIVAIGYRPRYVYQIYIVFRSAASAFLFELIIC